MLEWGRKRKAISSGPDVEIKVERNKYVSRPGNGKYTLTKIVRIGFKYMVPTI